MRYVAVARISDSTAVADYVSTDTRRFSRSLFEEKLEKVLGSGRVEQHGRLTITDKDVGSIHYTSDPVCLYFVITCREYPQRSAFEFLRDLKLQFEEEFGDDIGRGRGGSLSRSSRRMLEGLVKKYSDLKNVSRTEAVAVQVEEVKGAMQKNIQSVLKNQENLETLLDKTNAMKNEASTFQRTSERVKKKYFWENKKLMVVIIILLVILIAAIAIPIIVKT